jgi:hypothetical protein
MFITAKNTLLLKEKFGFYVVGLLFFDKMLGGMQGTKG